MSPASPRVSQFYPSWHILPVVLSLLLFSVFLSPISVVAQDSFQNVTCRDIPTQGTMCLIFSVEDCAHPYLSLRLNQSGSEVWKDTISAGQRYNVNLAGGQCNLRIDVANTPWVLTPTYARFSYSGQIACFAITIPLPPNEVVVGEDCRAHPDCQSCLASGVCGWCESGAAGGYVVDKICTAENKAETQPFCGTCTKWLFNDWTTCPMAPPPASSSTGSASSSTGGTSGGSSTDDVTPSSTGISTSGALALGFVLGGGAVAGAVGVAAWYWYRKRGGRRLVKTEEDTGVELRDGEEPLNDTKVQSETYEAPKARSGEEGHPSDL